MQTNCDPNTKKKKRHSSAISPTMSSHDDAKKRRCVSESDSNKSSLVDDEGVKEESSLNVKDFTCPICLEILIEPVVLQCKHELCLQCFNPYLENASLTCPLCRIRISVWARIHGKENTLVDTNRWELIQKHFPEHINRRRLSIMKDDINLSSNDLHEPKRVLASEGEIRKEYEEELKKLEMENVADARADMDLVRMLQAEEETLNRLEETDLKAAWNLQKEEMSKNGKPLRLPSEHKYKLSSLLKSPRKLRNRASTKRFNKKKSLSSRSCS